MILYICNDYILYIICINYISYLLNIEAQILLSRKHKETSLLDIKISRRPGLVTVNDFDTLQS